MKTKFRSKVGARSLKTKLRTQVEVNGMMNRNWRLAGIERLGINRDQMRHKGR